VQGNNRRGCD